MKNSYILEKEYEENNKHYQNALSLYEMILANVNETSENLCRHTDKKEYLDSARIGCLKAWVDSLAHMLNDVQIEALKQRMKIVADKQ